MNTAYDKYNRFIHHINKCGHHMNKFIHRINKCGHHTNKFITDCK